MLCLYNTFKKRKHFLFEQDCTVENTAYLMLTLYETKFALLLYNLQVVTCQPEDTGSLGV